VAALAVPRLILLIFVAWGAPAQAHQAGSVAGSWNLAPWLVGSLAAAAAFYVIGLARLWRKAGVGRGITPAQAARFALGWITLVAALVSPLDALGERLFSAHMVQHELLMVVAAPLLVLGRPLEAWTWAVRSDWRGALGRAVRWGWLRTAWGVITEPICAWAVHALALWTWHVPVLFEAALANEGLHILQHASFLGSALLFWWAVCGHGVRRPGAASIASLFTTMMHTGALGALLTFSGRLWYPGYAATTSAFGLDGIEDQQLGGLIMWVPAGLSYLAAGLWIAGSWLALREGAPSGIPRAAAGRRRS
jgi:putative membrane protein